MKAPYFIFDNKFFFWAGFSEVLIGLVVIFYPWAILPFKLSVAFGSFCLLLGCKRFYDYYKINGEVLALNAVNFHSINEDELLNHAPPESNKIYLGKGFIWENMHCHRYNQILALPETQELIDWEGAAGGKRFLHNIGRITERHLTFSDDTFQHTIIAGATRTGKSKLLKLLSYQFASKKQVTIFFDPKGDFDVLDAFYSSCVENGIKDKFNFFSLVHPKQSVSFNPIRYWRDSKDIASRIASIMPQDPKSKPFVDFCWKVLVTVLDVMIPINMEINLKNIHKYSLQNMEELQRLGTQYLEEIEDPGQAKMLAESLERLNVLIAHDRDHFSKMILSLEPVLTALATGEVGDLLSPEKGANTTSWKDIVDGNCVMYFYLGSMLDSFTSSAVAKLAIEDFLVFIGQRYAYETTKKPINLIIDEFYNVMFPRCIDLLNKAGGAGVRAFVAVQTESDVVTQSSESMAKQLFGNLDNKIFLRVPDKELAEGFSNLFGEVTIQNKIRVRNVSADPKSANQLFKSGFSERMDDLKVPLITPEMVTSLPVGEVFFHTKGKNPYKIRIPLLETKKTVKYSERILREFSFWNIGSDSKIFGIMQDCHANSLLTSSREKLFLHEAQN